MATLRRNYSPDGKIQSYEVRYDFVNEDGTRKQYKKRFAKYKDAESFMISVKARQEGGTFTEERKILVGAWLDEWYKVHSRKIEQTTADSYKLCIERMRPYIGGIKLQKLRRSHIEEMYGELYKTLSSSTVQRCHAVLRRALKDATIDEIVPRNVADLVDRPRSSAPPASSINPETVARILDKVYGTYAYLPILLACGLGLRRSEILGLRWPDVDLGMMKVTIRNVRVQTETQGVIDKRPKTDQSQRTLSLPKFIVDALQQHKKWQAENRVFLGPLYRVSDYVATMEDGGLILPNTISQRFKDTAFTLGSPKLRFHDLRHTNITHMIKAGVPITTVAARAGHSLVSTTTNTYGHVIAGMDEAAALILDQEFDVLRK